MYLMALERAEKRPNFTFEPIFADTQNEHEAVYEFIETLPKLTGGPPIRTFVADFTGKFESRREWIKENWPPELAERAIPLLNPSGNAFLDMTLLAGRFPSTRARFCTEYLKIDVMADQVYSEAWDAGDTAISWQGVRREESLARQDLPRFQWLQWRSKKSILAFRPLLDWKLQDVWDMHVKHGIARNPLYDHGFGRVGCFPCIMCTKAEVRLIAEKFPEHIDRLEAWEKLITSISKTGYSTFFPANTDPLVNKRIERTKAEAEKNRKIIGWEEPEEPLDPSSYEAMFEANEDGLLPIYDEPDPDYSWITQEEHGIRNIVRWSQTSWGGTQYDLGLINDAATSCDQWGACE